MFCVSCCLEFFRRKHYDWDYQNIIEISYAKSYNLTNSVFIYGILTNLGDMRCYISGTGNQPELLL